MAIPTIQGQAGVLTEPSLRFTSNNKPVANVRIAFNDSRYNDQTRQWENTKSFYVDCTAWDHVAERLAEHIRMGDQVYVEGRLETEEWEKDGQKRSKPNLTIRTIRPFAKTPQGGQPPQSASGGAWGAPAASPGGAWGGGQPQGQGDENPPF